MFVPRSVSFELFPEDGPLGPYLRPNSLDILDGEYICPDGEMFEVQIPLTPAESDAIKAIVDRASARWRSHVVAQLRDPTRATSE